MTFFDIEKAKRWSLAEFVATHDGGKNSNLVSFNEIAMRND
jgi:hypothetical protein